MIPLLTVHRDLSDTVLGAVVRALAEHHPDVHVAPHPRAALQFSRPPAHPHPRFDQLGPRRATDIPHAGGGLLSTTTPTVLEDPIDDAIVSYLRTANGGAVSEADLVRAVVDVVNAGAGQLIADWAVSTHLRRLHTNHVVALVTFVDLDGTRVERWALAPADIDAVLAAAEAEQAAAGAGEVPGADGPPSGPSENGAGPEPSSGGPGAAPHLDLVGDVDDDVPPTADAGDGTTSIDEPGAPIDEDNAAEPSAPSTTDPASVHADVDADTGHDDAVPPGADVADDEGAPAPTPGAGAPSDDELDAYVLQLIIEQTPMAPLNWSGLWAAVDAKFNQGNAVRVTAPELNDSIARIEIANGIRRSTTTAGFTWQRVDDAEASSVDEPEPEVELIGPDNYTRDLDQAAEPPPAESSPARLTDVDVIAYVAEHGPARASDIARGLNRSNGPMSQRLVKLADRGLLHRRPTGEYSTPAHAPDTAADAPAGDEAEGDLLADISPRLKATELVDLVDQLDDGMGAGSTDVHMALPWAVRSVETNQTIAAALSRLAGAGLLTCRRSRYRRAGD